MRLGLIIAAGKQSRFKQSLPKCLVSINGTCILDTTIANMSKYCDEVIVVCSIENESYFKKYNYVSINSGKGSGDAIYRAIHKFSRDRVFEDDDTVIIQWGDALVREKIYEMLHNIRSNSCIIPCLYEREPYVQVVPITRNKVAIRFSKYNDNISDGYHDMCVFSCKINYLYKYLKLFYDKFYNGEQYNHIHGNEFEFLDVFNDTDCSGIILLITNEALATKSFNTVEELEKLGGTYGI